MTEPEAEKRAWEIVRRIMPGGYMDATYMRAAKIIKAALLTASQTEQKA